MSMIGTIFGEIQMEDETRVHTSDFQAPVHTDWSIPEAYMCILLSAVYADGQAQPEEVEYLRALVKRCRTLRSQNTNGLAQMNITVSERIKTRPDAVGEACATLPKDMHLPLFAHSIDIVLADGELAEAERKFLDMLMETMDISAADAKKTMEVIFNKNRY